MDEESNAVIETVVADTTQTASATAETTSSEVTDEFNGLGDISLTNLDEVETVSKPQQEAIKAEKEEASETEAEVKSQDETKLAPKSENRFQKLANENRELKEQLERISARETQVATEQELINEINPETGEYYSPLDAERIAHYKANETLQTSLAEERQALETQQSQVTLVNEARQAISEFPMFDADSSSYNPEIAKQVDVILGQNLITDEQGQIVGSKISPYQLYKSYSDVYQSAASASQVKAQQATEKMLASVDQVSDAPVKGSSDPLEAAFDKIKDFKFSS